VNANELSTMNRSELQALAKIYGIRGNMKSDDIIAALKQKL